jgi:hypothetical protein
MVTTHSPFFVNGLRPEETWILFRDAAGFTQSRRASAIPNILEFVAHGGQLGHLWMEGYFDVGDPLQTSAGESVLVVT